MKYVIILLILVSVSCTTLPKVGSTFKVCWSCNNENGLAYYNKKSYKIHNTSTGQSYFIVRHKKIYIQKKGINN